jgi:hypothetical protein
MDGSWLEFELRREDLLRFGRFHLRSRIRPRWVPRVIPILLAVVVVLAGLVTLVDGGFAWATHPLMAVLLLLSGGTFALFLILHAGMPHLIAWAGARQRDVLGPHRLRLGEDGLHSVSPNATSVIAWSGLDRLAETPEAVYVFIDKDQAFIVPDRAFTDRTRAAFVATCQRHLDARRSGSAE